MLEIMSSLYQCLTFISKATNQKDNSYCQKIEFKESYWLFSQYIDFIKLDPKTPRLQISPMLFLTGEKMYDGGL